MPDHIICDIDGTLLNGADPIVKTIEFLDARPESVCIVSGREERQRAETVAALEAADVDYTELYLNDTDAGTVEFKTRMAEELMAEYNVVLAIDNDEAARAAYNTLGIETLAPDDIPEAAGAADEPKEEMDTFRHVAPVKLEVRESAMGTEYLTVTGYAAVFDQMSHDLGGFREIIEPGAFADVLGAQPDVHLVIGHNMDLPLARTRNGTLELGEDIRGLKMWARIDSRLSYAKDLAVQLKSGLVDQMSFAFTIPEGGDTWAVDDSGAVTRTVNRIDGLYDVSVVAAGAYPQTDVQAVRALLRDAADKGLIPSNLLDTSQPETVGGDSVEQHAGGVVESDTGDRQAIQNLQAAKAKTKAAIHTHKKGL
jgi:HK97 family phage prohead protease